jgi:hypothetical protein
MTTLSTAQESFVSAFRTWLTQLEPNSKGAPQERFWALSEQARQEKPLTERLGTPRLFDVDVDNPVLVRHDYVGADTQGITFDYPLAIAYPRAVRWQAAMLDDYVRIRCGVLDLLTKPAGVALIIVPEGLTIEQVESDPWTIARITVRVTYDVTRT